MKVICPSCKEVIDVDETQQYGYCNKCSNQFVNSDARNALIKRYKSINNYARSQLFTDFNTDEAYKSYKSLLELKPYDFAAISGMSDCIFISSDLKKFKCSEVIDLFESYEIVLDKENTYLFLNYMLEIMKYIRIYYREVERTKKDDCFISLEFFNCFIKNNDGIIEVLEYFDQVFPLLDQEEYDTFRNIDNSSFVEDYKALETKANNFKNETFKVNKVGTVNYNGEKADETPVDFEYEELQDLRIFYPNTQVIKGRKITLIVISVLFVIFAVMLITGLVTKIHLISYLSLIPVALIGVAFFIFYKKTK